MSLTLSKGDQLRDKSTDEKAAASVGSKRGNGGDDDDDTVGRFSSAIDTNAPVLIDEPPRSLRLRRRCVKSLCSNCLD